MFRFLNLYLANNFPALGKPKRFFLAYLSMLLPTKRTYSQINDDQIAMSLLRKKYGRKSIFYVDIGANHPSRLSNTYLMYRLGNSGLTIDPNTELMHLHKITRPRDSQLSIGCGKKTELKNFYSSTTPVLSSFIMKNVSNVLNINFLPIFTLDDICNSLNIKHIDFLSIDTEGLDLDVLQGAKKILENTFLVCVEANSSIEEKKIVNFLSNLGFNLKVKNQWNLFFTRN